ncbi:putative bifunctional diguanylate cyclase/phosphodiesterase [Pseudohaliea rubra]|uniref:Diguanylate cyclase/phosphodiesterase (GGDEF & EAL domain protein) with PAS/PAC sensor(S) n=1 Tax=Pseudohaliea rubra DSM 19751 TaxID=1265313 RepID=A0A095VUW7_9GAMM|nr:bifunctional diguanylate cyclase/phosphodiesterase [Pseudohaliea rubra]KGE05120.1 diguanylate cyclase/phosphodiesterase (GGDEF & EAL domain protein) with PAS/PAC sensor(s) [Pseudohaliea rubra DSM 19751]
MQKAVIAAVRIVAPYLVVGILWIYVSDNALLLVVSGDAGELGRLQTFKGWLFITITTAMLFALSYSHLRQIHRLQELDTQTGLLHRRLFLEYLDDRLERDSSERDMLVLILNIDGFTAISQQLSKAKAEQVLEQLGAHLRASFTADTLLSRLGTDEFVLALPLIAAIEREKPLERALRARRVLLKPLGDEGVRATACGGAALYPRDGRDAHGLVAAATSALRAARNRGPDHINFYDDRLTRADRHRQNRVRELRDAIARRELYMHYQPQVRLADNSLAGCEALVRWNDTADSPIPPAEFVPLAEQFELSRKLSELVIGRVIEDLEAAGLTDGCLPRISINLTPDEFARSDFVHWLKDQLAPMAQWQMKPQIEITEYAALRDLRASIGRIRELGASGIDFSLDDFGTGYSSLAALKDLPVQELKIDGSFITTVNTDGRSLAIVKSITRLADTFNLRVLAEGVETREQLERLRECRCEEAQGFYFGRPVASGELAAMLRRNNSNFTVRDC